MDFLNACGNANDGVEEIAKMIDEGADIEYRLMSSGITPLHRAVLKGNWKIVRLLIDRGADPSPRDNNGSTPLHIACESIVIACESIDIALARTLIKCGADVNARDIRGITPAYIATEYNHDNILKLLIENGANINYRYANINILRGRTTVVQIQNNGGTLLHQSICSSSPYISKMLIENGAYLNVQDDKGTTPLELALMGNNNYVSSLLILMGAKIEAGDLCYAAMGTKEPKIYEMLLKDKLVNVNHKNKEGKSAVTLAAEKGNYEGLKIILGLPNLIIDRSLIHTLIDNNCYDLDVYLSLLKSDEEIFLSINRISQDLYMNPVSIARSKRMPSDIVDYFLSCEKVAKKHGSLQHRCADVIWNNHIGTLDLPKIIREKFRLIFF